MSARFLLALLELRDSTPEEVVDHLEFADARLETAIVSSEFPIRVGSFEV